MKSPFLTALAIAFLSGASSLHAHHGQEFFLLYDAQVQKPMHGILQGNFSFIDEGTDDSIGLSPSLISASCPARPSICGPISRTKLVMAGPTAPLSRASNSTSRLRI